MGKEPKDRRGLSPRSASAPVANPGPRYGGRFPGSCSSNPARAVQLIAPASAPLPLAGIFEESRASWTRKARRLPPAVGAGPLSAGGWGHPPLRKEVRTIGKRTRAWCKQPWRPIHFRPRKNSKVSAYCGHYGPPFTCYSGKRKGRRRGEKLKLKTPLVTGQTRNAALQNAFSSSVSAKKGVQAREGAKAWNLFRDGAEAKRSFAESSFAYFSYKKSRRSGPGIGTRAPIASWCHPISEQAGPVPFGLLLREGDRARLRARW